MQNSANVAFTDYIREIPDFPKPGILFRDITPLLASPNVFEAAIQQMAAPFRDQKIDMVVAAEARGFIFGTPIAMELGAGFVPVRKPGKLPSETHSYSYELEYGEDTLEMHIDGVKKGHRVLIVDDLLATGGTIQACCELVENCGADVIACTFLIELKALAGAERIAPREVFRLIEY